MSDKPSLRKDSSASAAAKTPADGAGAPPRPVLIAAGALALSGVMAVVAALGLFAGSVKSWIRDSARDSYSDTMLDKLDDARKAGPSSGDRGTQLDQLQNQLRDLKRTASDMLNAKLGAIYDRVDALKPGASKKGQDAFDDIRDRLDDVRKIGDQITAAQKTTLISSIILLVALGLAAGAVYRGKHWSRWVVIGLWVLATFSSSVAGVSSVLGIAADIPALFKFPSFVSAAALVVAVVLVNMRACLEYLNRGRPARPAGRGGLFGPRPSAAPRGAARTAPAATRSASPDRARTKQRSDRAASTAKGADLARSRAKAANKSRRSGS